MPNAHNTTFHLLSWWPQSCIDAHQKGILALSIWALLATGLCATELSKSGATALEVIDESGKITVKVELADYAKEAAKLKLPASSWAGSDDTFPPKTIVQSIAGTVNGTKFTIPAKETFFLSQANEASVAWRKAPIGNEMIGFNIFIRGGDGGLGYVVEFHFAPNGDLIGKDSYSTEFPTESGERITYIINKAN